MNFFALAVYGGQPHSCCYFDERNKSIFLSKINRFNDHNTQINSDLRWVVIPETCVKKLFDIKRLIRYGELDLPKNFKLQESK